MDDLDYKLMAGIREKIKTIGSPGISPQIIPYVVDAMVKAGLPCQGLKRTVKFHRTASWGGVMFDLHAIELKGVLFPFPAHPPSCCNWEDMKFPSVFPVETPLIHQSPGVAGNYEWGSVEPFDLTTKYAYNLAQQAVDKIQEIVSQVQKQSILDVLQQTNLTGQSNTQSKM